MILATKVLNESCISTKRVIHKNQNKDDIYIHRIRTTYGRDGLVILEEDLGLLYKI